MKPRLIAFSVHLLATFLALGGILYWLFHWAYPGDLLVLQGGQRLFVATVLASFVAGPLLTLIAFRLGKRTLVPDMLTIVVLQVAILGAAVWALSAQRPVVLSFVLDRFFAVSREDIQGDIHKLLSRTKGVGGMRLAQAPFSEEIMEEGQKGSIRSLLSQHIAAGQSLPPFAVMVEALGPYPFQWDRIQKAGQPISDFGEVIAAPFRKVASEAGLKETEVLIMPVVGRRRNGFAVLRRTDGHFLGVKAPG